MDINTFLSRIWSLQENHFFLFFLTSFLTTLIGISLSVAKPTKFNRLSLYVHVLPLFIAPVLISKVVIDFFSLHYSSKIGQSHMILAILGVLFHSWLASFLLVHLFNFKTRLSDFLFIFNTSSSLGIRNPPIYALFILKFCRPILMTWAILHVFFESMISPCVFTNTGVYSVIYTMMDSSKEIGFTWLNPLLAGITCAVFVLYILFSYSLSLLLEKKMIRRISNFEKRIQKKVQPINWSLFLFFSKKMMIFLKYCSLLFQSTVVVITMTIIIRSIVTSNENANSILKNLGRISNTLFSDAVKIGVGTLIIFSLWTFKKLTSYNANSFFVKYRYRLLIAAILPPVIYGVLGFAVSINNDTYIIAKWFFLIFYSLVLFIFFLNWPRLTDQQPLFVNAKRTSQPLSNRLYLLISSHTFNLINAFVLTLYILWTEDGIQTLLSKNDNYLAANIRGFRTSTLTSGTTTGLLIAFFLIIVILSGIKWLEIKRHKFINRKMAQKIILGLILLSFCQSVISQSKSGKTQIVKLTTKWHISKISVTEAGLILLLPEKGYHYEIDTIIIENNHPTISINNGLNTSLTVNKVIIAGNQSLINIKGLTQNVMLSLEIKGISLNDYKAPSIKVISLNLDKLSIHTSNDKKIGLDLAIENSCNINNIEISGVKVNHLTINCNNEMTINLSDIISTQVVIKGNNKDQNRQKAINLIMTRVYFEPEYNHQQSSLEISELDLITTKIEIEKEANTDIQGPFKCFVHDCNLLNDLYVPGQENHFIKINKVYTTIDLSKILLSGKLFLKVENLEDLSFLDIKSIDLSDAIFDCQIMRSENKVPKISLEQIDVSKLKVCISEVGEVDANFRHIKVQEEFEVSENILESMNGLNKDKPAFARNEFFSLLKSNGRICDQKEDLGLEALYQKKKAETKHVSKLMAFIIDNLTGYGIHITKALWTFLIYSFAFWCINIIFTKNNEKKSMGKKAKHGLLYLIFSSHNYEENLNHIAMHRWSHLYRIILFIQITLLGIYLGQITLQ